MAEKQSGFMQEPKKQPGQSKYDFVKVKVWLGEHYYILSRFLISRMLTVTKIPYIKAVKIALELKKYLVDREELDVSQASLEEALFRIMYSRGFREDYICRYKMVTNFFQQKRPLIILLCGVSGTGKSTFAQALASRLNLPNVLQTDIIYELLQLSGNCSAPKPMSQPLDPKQVISAFQTECRDVRRGIDGDLTKSIRDGKPIIIEGLHLDPGLYLYEFGKYGVAHLLRNSSLSSGLDRHELEHLDSKLLDGAQSRLPLHRTLQRSLSAHEVAFFLQRNSAPSASSSGQASFQHKLAGALSSKSFDSSPKVPTQFVNSGWPGMAQGAEDMEQGLDTLAGRSPASEWLQQFLPCFSGQQQQQPPAHADGSPISHEATASASQRTSSNDYQADQQQQQQQQLDAPLSRGQLFHCWRRKPDSSAAAAVVGRPRRASFHAGQHMQPLSADRIPLHGPGRPLSSDQLSPQPGTTDQPFLSSARPFSQTDPSNVSLPTKQEPPVPQQPSSTEDGSLWKPVSACEGAAHAAGSQAHNYILQRESLPNETDGISHAGFPKSHGLEQPEASSDNSSITAQENLKHRLAGSATSSSGCLSTLGKPSDPRKSSVNSQAACSESSSRTRSANGQGASNLSEQMPEQSGDQQGQDKIEERPGSPSGPHGPLFVPIVLTLEPRDHEVLLREAASRNLGSCQDADAWVEQALQRSAILQEHLRTYASKSIPILQLTLADFSSRLDTLHDYLLQCMEAAMSRH